MRRSTRRDGALGPPAAQGAGFFVYVLGQGRLLRWPFAGLLHALIFWGFLVLLTAIAQGIVEALWQGFQFQLLPGQRRDRVPAGPVLPARRVRRRDGALQPPRRQPHAISRQPSRRRPAHPPLDRRAPALHGAQLRDADRAGRAGGAGAVAPSRRGAVRDVPAAGPRQRGARRAARHLLLGPPAARVRLPRVPGLQQAPAHHHRGAQRPLQERAAQGCAAARWTSRR